MTPRVRVLLGVSTVVLWGGGGVVALSSGYTGLGGAVLLLAAWRAWQLQRQIRRLRAAEEEEA